ncbi:MAG: VWA domain-containing protein [Nibricoccus sp.]
MSTPIHALQNLTAPLGGSILGTWNLPLGTLDLRLANPEWLFALLLIPIVIWMRGRRRVPVLVVPFASSWHRKSFTTVSRWPEILAAAGITLLIVALARPQTVHDKREVRSEGYDLMLAIDISSSMLAEDYEKNGQPINRLQAVKPVIQAFIEERSNDRIGLVVFSGRAYTMAPLTFDHDWLSRQTERIQTGIIEDGTAIGDGLGVALTRLEQASHEEGGRRKGAFVILLTDGRESIIEKDGQRRTLSTLPPDQAAGIAKSRGIPVYTIGAGKDGWARRPVIVNGRKLGYDRFFSDLDEGLLHDIADTTGGRFFRADDNRTIKSAFDAINRSRKIEFKAKTYLITTELFPWCAIPSLALLLLAALLRRTNSNRPSSQISNSSNLKSPGASALQPVSPSAFSR